MIELDSIRVTTTHLLRLPGRLMLGGLFDKFRAKISATHRGKNWVNSRYNAALRYMSVL